MLTTSLSVALLPDATTGPGKVDQTPLLRPPMPRGGAYRNFEEPGTATFFLTAPFKSRVCLAGDFNGWKPRATPMHTDGWGHFWVTVPVRGRVRYQFVLARDEGGKQVWVADPYAREITWDAFGAQAVLAGESSYVWRDHGWQRPPLDALTIYELCVRDFTGCKDDHGERFGTFAGVQARLDHLAALGINAIELMPVCEFPGNSSWGYNPVFYMAPKWNYGRPSTLKSLVDAAHQRGIAVILDMVFNHAWAEHPYYRMYPPLFGRHGEMLEDRNPFFHHHNNGHANGWGGIDWEHQSPYTRAYMQDIVRYWLDEYHMDGFRFDWVGGVEFDPWQPQRENFDPDFGIAPIAQAARDRDPACYLIGEYWPILGTNHAKTAARLVRETAIDAVWNDTFHHVIERCLFQTWQWERQDITEAVGGFACRGFEHAAQLVNYVVSHDERRPEHEIQFWGEHIQLQPADKPAEFRTRWELAMHKARLGMAALMTAPGVPMIFAGQEFGEDSPRTIAFWPIDWNKLALPEGRRQFDFYRLLIRLRREHPALRSDYIEFYGDDFARYKTLRYKRWDGNGDVVVVALNFDCVAQRIGLGFPAEGCWREVLSGDRIEIKGCWHDLTLPPWSAAILVPDRASA